MQATQGVRQAAEWAHRLYPATSVRKARDPALLAAARLAVQRLGLAQRKWREALKGIWTTGAKAGAHRAAQQLGTDVDPSWDAFWDAWTPGEKPAVGHLRNGGMREMLERADISIQNMNKTMLDRVAAVLADSLEAGDTLAMTVERMNENLGKIENAKLIAKTEMSRAVNRSAVEAYARHGLTRWNWEVNRSACVMCVSESEENPHELGDEPPPRHGSCACSASPAF